MNDVWMMCGPWMETVTYIDVDNTVQHTRYLISHLLKGKSNRGFPCVGIVLMLRMVGEKVIASFTTQTTILAVMVDPYGPL